jgi:hypothetical protein
MDPVSVRADRQWHLPLLTWSIGGSSLMIVVILVLAGRSEFQRTGPCPLGECSKEIPRSKFDVPATVFERSMKPPDRWGYSFS